MKIYFAHSREHDFREELYKPIRNSELNTIAEVILPHEINDKPWNSKEDLKTVDFMVAEVSFPSIGLGIELGWANLYGTNIIAFYKKGTKVTDAVKTITENILEYSSPQELIEQMLQILKSK